MVIKKSLFILKKSKEKAQNFFSNLGMEILFILEKMRDIRFLH